MALTTAALLITVLLAAFAVLRLAILRIYRTLPLFFSFICYQFVTNFVTLFLSPGSVSSEFYQWTYISIEPLNWVFEILMVRELYRTIFRNYPGIASMARWNSYVSAAMAVLVCGLVVYSDPAGALTYSSMFASISLWERCVSFVLVLFVISMALLLSRFPIPIPFNVASHAIIFTIFFFANFVVLEIGTFPSTLFWKIGYYGATIIYAGGFLAWGLAMRRETGVEAVSIRTARSGFERDKLIGQLEWINDALMKSARQ